MRNKPLFLAVVSSTVIPAVVFSGLIPVYSDRLMALYGVSREELGRWLMFLLVGFGPVGLFTGHLAARFGAVRVLVLSQVLTGAGLAVFALHPRPGVVSWAAILAGMTGCTLVSISNKVTVDLMDGKRKNVGTNLLHGVNAAGKVAGPLVAGIFAGGMWRLGFGVSSLLPLALAVWIWKSGGAYHREEKEEEKGPAREVFADPLFWASLAGFAFIAGSELCATLALPGYLKELGFDDRGKAFLTASFTGGIVSGRFAAAMFLGRVPPRFLVYGCGLFAGALGFVGKGGWGATAAALFVSGLTFSTAWPSYFAHLCGFFPRHRAYLAGGSGLANSLGLGAAAWLSGYLSDEFGLGTAVAAGGLLFGAWLGVMAVVNLAFAGRRKRGTQAPVC